MGVNGFIKVFTLCFGYLLLVGQQDSLVVRGRRRLNPVWTILPPRSRLQAQQHARDSRWLGFSSMIGLTG